MTETQLRDSLVNADARDRDQFEPPHDLPILDWDHLDFLAWRDPRTRSRGYLVAELAGLPTGVILRAANSTSGARHGICDLCRTMQPGNQVTMFTARKAGPEGEIGNSIGTYICADLGCHEAVRLALPLAPNEYRTSVDMKIEGTTRRALRFLGRAAGVPVA